MYDPGIDIKLSPPLPGIAAATYEKGELATFPEVEKKIVTQP